MIRSNKIKQLWLFLLAGVISVIIPVCMVAQTNVDKELVKSSNLLDQNKLSEALASYENILQEEKGNQVALYHKALTLFYLHDGEKALETLDSLLLIAPENAEAYHLKAIILLEQRLLDGALESAEKAIDIDPDLNSARTTRCSIYSEMADKAALKKCLKELK
jgi:tetratricopeptide (TPR) repeat protein